MSNKALQRTRMRAGYFPRRSVRAAEPGRQTIRMISRSPEGRRELILGFFGIVESSRGTLAFTRLGKIQLACLAISMVLVIVAFSYKPPERSALIPVSGQPEIAREWKESRREFRSEKLHYCILFTVSSFAGKFEYCETPRPHEHDPDSDYALKYWDFAILRNALKRADRITVLVPEIPCVPNSPNDLCAYYEISTESNVVVPYGKFYAKYQVSLLGAALLLSIWTVLFFVNINVSQQRLWEKQQGSTRE